MSIPSPATTQVAKFIEAPIAGRPTTAPLGTFFYATDTLDLYAFSVNLTTGVKSWVIVGSGGGAAQPATQILEGTGTGVTSSPSLTYSQTLGTLTAADQESPPAAILSVVGTSNPATRALNVFDQSLRTIFQVIASSATRSISAVDEASTLLLQVLTLAAQRTLTVFDGTGSPALTFATIVGAVAATFGHIAGNRLKVDVTNGQLLGLSTSGATTFVLDEATGGASLGTTVNNGNGSLTMGNAAKFVGIWFDDGGVPYQPLTFLDATGQANLGIAFEDGTEIVRGAWGTIASPYLGLWAAITTGFFIEMLTAQTFEVQTAGVTAFLVNTSGNSVIINELDLTASTANVAESFSDQSGTPGNATANTIRGRVAMAIGAKTLTLTNNRILSANSQLKVWFDHATTDTTATTVCAKCTGAGSATVGTNANATAATVIGFEVVN
jgi:hypothetical protein